MNVDLKRYDLFGWDYEYNNPLTDKEIVWYLKFAQELEGPILELACGTARLLTSFARAGFDVEGIDLSKGMVEIARKKISQLPFEIRARIRIHNLDMSDFHLDRKFSLIVIADNSFGELKTREKQLLCLRSVYHHLRPSGKLLLTVRRFDPKEFVRGRRDSPWSKPIRHPITGHQVRRKIQMQLTENGKRIRGKMFYSINPSDKTTYRDGSEKVEECPFETPVMFKEDYLSLFSEAGFSASVFVGYEEKEDDGKNPILCFVCDKDE